MGGFEACNALSEHRQRLDMIGLTKHDLYCRADYRLLKQTGIFTIRESMAWHLIDGGGGAYDFSRYEKMMVIARDEGMQVIWSLNHFDIPAWLDLFSPDFAPRFAEYAVAAVRTIRRYDDDVLYINPLNEISFYSWMCAEVGVWGPHHTGRGFEAKLQMVRATLAAVKAVKAMDARIKFVHIDPVMRRTAAPRSSPEVRKFVRDFRGVVYQTWDMIVGKIYPELGGSRDCMDIVGVNYYIYNQEKVLEVQYEPNFEVRTRRLGLNSKARLGFDRMLNTVYNRYRKPILITETGSHGALRIHWWRRLLRDIDKALLRKIPLLGVCAYPIIDRPDWHYGHLTNSGFWDFEGGDEHFKRIPHVAVLAIIKKYVNQMKEREERARKEEAQLRMF